MGPGQATFIIPAMYVLHTVLTIVSGELFYQTYIPMVSPIGSEAVRSRLPFPFPWGHPLCFPVVPRVQFGETVSSSAELCFLYVWIWMRWKRPA